MTTCGEITTFWPMLHPRPIRAPVHHVREVPDLCPRADLTPLVDVGWTDATKIVSRAHFASLPRASDEPVRCRRGRNRLPDSVREQHNRRPAIVDAEAPAGQHFFVHAGMEIAEAVAELDLFWPSTVMDLNVVLTPGSGARRAGR